MSKYHAIPCQVDGYTFASQREGRRYSDLAMLLRSGIIRDLELQPKYECLVNGQRIGEYRADFRYASCETGRVTVEDSKGMATPLYKWKKKHVEAQYGIRIIEV